MAIWLLMGTTWYALIIHQTLNAEELTLLLQVININYLNECIVFDISLGYK